MRGRRSGLRAARKAAKRPLEIALRVHYVVADSVEQACRKQCGAPLDQMAEALGVRRPTAARLYVPLIFGGCENAFRGDVMAGLIVAARSPRCWTTALRFGPFVGFFGCPTYDLANQATLKVWSTTTTLADMAWGSVLTAVAATAGYFAALRFALS